MNIREDLLRDGAALYPNALPMTQIERLRSFCFLEVQNYKPTVHRRDSPAAPVSPLEPIYREVIERGAFLLGALGFTDLRWLAGALIPKWLGEGRRGNHIDWWAWEGSIADTARDIPPQVGMLFYLDDAVTDTGALTFVPGSHRREIPRAIEGWERWDPVPGERTVPALAGDAILLDARTLHGVTANRTMTLRLCLTVWFLIGYEQLSERTRATTMLSIPDEFQAPLGPLCPIYRGPASSFPHIKKPQFPIVLDRIDALRQGHTDRAIVGVAAHPEDVFLDGETYGWYYGLGAAKAPRRILELGVRHGYSLIALAKGAQWAGVEPELTGVDAERDGHATNASAQTAIEQETGIFPRILRCDTTRLDATNAALNETGYCYDLIHVDGDHSPEGIEAELKIAETWIRPNGLIVVDDIDVEHIREAGLQLCAQFGIPGIELPTVHGTLVIDMKKRTRYA